MLLRLFIVLLIGSGVTAQPDHMRQPKTIIRRRVAPDQCNCVNAKRQWLPVLSKRRNPLAGRVNRRRLTDAEMRREAMLVAPRIVIGGQHLPESGLQLLQWLSRLRHQIHCRATPAMAEVCEMGQRDIEEGTIVAYCRQLRRNDVKRALRRKWVEQREMRHPAVDLAVVLPADGLDWLPDGCGREHDQRAAMGFAGDRFHIHTSRSDNLADDAPGDHHRERDTP